MRGICVGVRSFAPVACAMRFAARRPASSSAAPDSTSIDGCPERSACAIVPDRCRRHRGRAGGARGAPGSAPSFQAQSAGRISVAVPPGGVRAAWIAAAASAPTLPALVDVRTQADTVRARPSVSAVSGASCGR